MVRIAVIGCGIIGASIAFELSRFPELKVTVFDKQQPAQSCTGAALGVLMGIISSKIKGRNWYLRERSLRDYETLIPELESITGRKIPFNKQGILMLFSEGEDLSKWENLAAVRKSQGWQLEMWDVKRAGDRCPYLYLNDNIIAAVYSPQDRQIDPTALTLALVDAAGKNGVDFEFGAAVNILHEGTAEAQGTQSVGAVPPCPPAKQVSQLTGLCRVETSSGSWDFDRLIVAAGLDSGGLTASLNRSIDIRPVLGQAVHLRLPNPLGNADFAPVITCDDVHIVPLGNRECWVGATVEFPENNGEIVPDGDLLCEVMARAIALCPALAEAEIVKQWSGLRPRPEGRPAPIIDRLSGNSNVLVASGHYRNGVLLAPATARSIREMILQ
ncbi:MAG: FAD-binding oxidoreductase [Oscillatoriaceae cyanobacterium Prado104]|jgi:glycine/D-amino acid oxidase-like deaminating enzyme|nr:FAD-binding oxidoreductase [Oscillatoriaceae cyanobacterium Prado104]